MGLKFKNKTTAGTPVGGDVKERELGLDLKNGSIYSSTDGTDIIKIGSGLEQGGVLWVTGTNYLVGDIVTDDVSGKVYSCLTPHTASALFATDIANWSEVISASGGSMTGNLSYKDNVLVTVIDCSIGNSSNITVAADFTQTFSNLPTTGELNIQVITLTNGGAFTITWDGAIVWEGGTAPALTTTDTVTLYTIDGGAQWHGSVILGYA